MSGRPTRPERSAFRLFRPIATRWMDNDAYGHVNNVHYYSYFDSAVNGWLVEYVDRRTRKPGEIPPDTRAMLSGLI